MLLIRAGGDGGWGLLSKLVFTSCVKAVQCGGIALKSVDVEGFGCLDTTTVTETGREILCLSQSMSLLAAHPFYHASNCPMELLKIGFTTSTSGLQLILMNWLNLMFEFMTEDSIRVIICSVKSSPLISQPADPLEETDLPGIVFRLSSLTITKALIRLDNPSSAGSDGLLVLLCCRCGGGLWFVRWGYLWWQLEASKKDLSFTAGFPSKWKPSFNPNPRICEVSTNSDMGAVRFC